MEQPEAERPAPDDDALVRDEEEAAAIEAGGIGGMDPETEADEATRPVEEAGGGEAEGFEQAERDLGERAAHGEERSTPETDAFAGEKESDRASVAYSEPDEVDPTEVVSDPEEGSDDPGQGPGIASER